jgi:uncharacterized membrane protein YdfJ with MMPL/SSD domain
VSTNLAHTNLVGACAKWAVRYRWPVAIVWLAVVVVGGWASDRLSAFQGETIALPIALIILLAVFGLSLVVTIPLLFAACTVFGTLGIVYVFAHYMTTPTYVTNLVFLIGIRAWVGS